MKFLDEIPAFPKAAREILESQYGIATAEAFFDHAIHASSGLQQALGVSEDEVNRLSRLVEGYLSPDFIARARQPLTKHPRGALF
jgi:Mn-dependent DtxR family transcriptional regulator